ncbi:sugar O-acetyltransferase [candidate division KSB1 bacterium]|nr:sugar O-acetyltransferase [candidate division KSB1 bacterium]
MKSEKEKMLAGELYNASDPLLSVERHKARMLIKKFNDSSNNDKLLRTQILRELFGSIGDNLEIEPPFFCDYGYNISIGNNVFFNFNCIVLDVSYVAIGDYTMLGPNVQIYTATHPMDWQTRATMLEYAKPVSIGAHVWIGGSAVICPGVSIGDKAVVGAGSVVTKDIPSNVFAAGNPCKIIRELDI